MTSAPPDRRTRKRLATRQTISDTATRLFLEHGFDRVTIDEIAKAADVGRMTVFTHFPRKEDMFFDEDQTIRDLVLDALKTRKPSCSPITAMYDLMHHLATSQHSPLRFSEQSRRFIQTIANSETLKARARAIRDEVTLDLTRALADAVGRTPDDPEATLTASLVTTTVSIAFLKAHDAFRSNGNEQAARSLFLEIFDRGVRGVVLAMNDTPYTAGSSQSGHLGAVRNDE